MCMYPSLEEVGYTANERLQSAATMRKLLALAVVTTASLCVFPAVRGDCSSVTCSSFGYVEIPSGGGECAFCLSGNSAPSCPGINCNGEPFTTTTGATTTTTTTPPTTTTTPPITTTTTTPPTTTTTTTPPTTTTTTTPPTTTTTPPVTTTTTPPTTPPVTTTTPPVTTTTPPVTTTTPPVTTTTPPVTTTTTTQPITTTTTPPVTTTTPPTTVPPSTTAPCEKSTCADKTIGLYPYPLCDCQRYYTCTKPASGGSLIKHEYTCLGNYVFDKDLTKCVADTTACPHA
ncbi:integumentary mucin C.1-like [Penaeus chinensis]|uniref:integumentary mucin C.1-like n=1 Tax=Penaeus chinensis TaxID=139456 RepID=UPI001FB6D32F|nr:integumentary mucin C.1-like [Penaeus chinensis]